MQSINLHGKYIHHLHPRRNVRKNFVLCVWGEGNTSLQACCRTPYYIPELIHCHLPYEASHPTFSCTDHLGPLNCAPTQSTKSNTSEAKIDETGDLASIHCNKKEMKIQKKA